MHLSPEQLEAFFPYFMAVWATAALLAAAFFHISKNAGLKRKVFPVLYVVADIVMLGFFWLGRPPVFFMVFAAAVAVFGTWQAIRLTWFCNTCGANNFPQGSFNRREACKKCGELFVPGQR